MADFQALQQKYAPVVDTIKEFEPYGAKFVGSQLTGEQFHLVAQVPSQVVVNRVWDAIKNVDSQYSDLSKVSKLSMAMRTSMRRLPRLIEWRMRTS